MNMVETSDTDAEQAIGISIRENRTVRIEDATGSQSIVLDELAEDSVVANGGEVEYWGTREYDGQGWRVHVVVAQSWLASVT